MMRVVRLLERKLSVDVAVVLLCRVLLCGVLQEGAVGGSCCSVLLARV